LIQTKLQKQVIELFTLLASTTNGSFDEDMEEYGCEIFSVDPSKEMVREKPYQQSPQVTFYNWGLSNKDKEVDGNWPGMMRSLPSIYGTTSLIFAPYQVPWP
jgi:hypothetical protein